MKEADLGIVDTRTRRSQGFSLIELIIVMLLSISLASVVLGLYLSQKKAQLEIRQLLELELNAQAVMLFLTDSIELAGYTNPKNIGVERENLFPQDARFGAGQVVAVEEGGSRLLTRMYGAENNLVHSCRGNPLMLNQLYIREFRLDGDSVLCIDRDKDYAEQARSIVSNHSVQLKFNVEFVEFGSPPRYQVKQIADNNEVLNLSAITVDIVQRSASIVRNRSKETDLMLSSGERFQEDDKYVYYKLSKFIRAENHGVVVELN